MKQSHNRNVLKNLIRRERNFSREDWQENIDYLILYSFLYKYLSDNLKNFLESLTLHKKDLKSFYEDDELYEMIKEESLENLGYFFKNYDAFIDVVMGEEYVENYFTNMFFAKLKENMIFKSESQEDFFEPIFEILKESDVDDLLINNRRELIIHEYIRFIAKLDIAEEDFAFQQVYDVIASSRMVKVSVTPDYITGILKKVISANVGEVNDVYDPFLKDASLLIGLSNEMNITNIYGKEESKINYFYSLIKAVINGYSPENISFFNQNAVQSMSIEYKTFDVIISNISNRFSSRYYEQSLESPDISSGKDELKKVLLSKFEESDFQYDKNVMDALDILIKEVDASRSANESLIGDEYASLNESEFLFIINMLNSLKQDGIMAISISQNFLFKKSLRLLRKFLTYKTKFIDAIISVPEELGRGIRPEVVIVFRKNRSSDDILFIDPSKIYKTAKSPNTVPGLFRRNLVLTDECLDKIADIYVKREKIDKISNVVDLNQLIENDFNLAVSRYVDTYEGEFISLSDLKNEKIESDLKIDELNKKIEKLMDDLDIKL